MCAFVVFLLFFFHCYQTFLRIFYVLILIWSAVIFVIKTKLLHYRKFANESLPAFHPESP